MKIWYMLGLLMLALNCTASVYYVNNDSGDDANDGLSTEKPFRTIHTAMSKLSRAVRLLSTTRLSPD